MYLQDTPHADKLTLMDEYFAWKTRGRRLIEFPCWAEGPICAWRDAPGWV